MSETTSNTPSLSELVSGNSESVKAAVAAKVAEKPAKKTKAPKTPASKPAKAAKKPAPKKVKAKATKKPAASKKPKAAKKSTGKKREAQIEITARYLIDNSGKPSLTAPLVAAKFGIKEVEVHRAAARLEERGYTVGCVRGAKREGRGRRPFIFTVEGKPNAKWAAKLKEQAKK